MLYDWTINNPSTERLFKKRKKKCVFTWLCQVLVAGMQGL